jgi:hypothetical protein
MGSGAPPLAGYGQAAFFHDFYACTPDGGCPNYQFQVVRWTDRLLYGMSSTPPQKPGAGWGNYFYYGDLPLLGWFVGESLLL